MGVELYSGSAGVLSGMSSAAASARRFAARVFGAKGKVCGMMHARAFKSATAADARALFDCLMVKSEGDVKSMQCDIGSEFKGAFEQGLMGSGIHQHTIPPSSPI